jgi:bifunctional ADP-heptose synthase (sugar kinase/adenylyltransferase)
MMIEARLQELLGGFPKARIAVIGDFFLDKLLLIDRSLDEPSLETGLTAYQVTGKRISPGAAGTVMNNLAALGVGTLFAVGFRGEDGEGWELEQGLKARGVDTGMLVMCPELFTPTYTKPMFEAPDGPAETNRLDIRNRGPLPRQVEDRIIENLHAAAARADAVIALDQVVERNTGVITDRVRGELAALGRSRPDLILYADSRARSMEFGGVIVKCNHLEAVRAFLPGFTGEPDDAMIRESALALSRRTGRTAFVTCGAKGIYAVSGDDVTLIPAVRVEGPVDICGAGDAATSGIVSALCCGATPQEAALVANLTASITIQQIGTTGTATRGQVADRFRERFVPGTQREARRQ